MHWLQIQDFREGCQQHKGCVNLLFANFFAKNCMKMRKIESGEGIHGTHPLDLPLCTVHVMTCTVMFCSVISCHIMLCHVKPIQRLGLQLAVYIFKLTQSDLKCH